MSLGLSAGATQRGNLVDTGHANTFRCRGQIQRVVRALRLFLRTRCIDRILYVYNVRPD